MMMMLKNPQKLVPLSFIVFVYLSTTTSLSSFSIFTNSISHDDSSLTHPYVNYMETPLKKNRMKVELDRSRIAVCLVGGARRFELTGESIVEKILKVYLSSDLFLNSPRALISFCIVRWIRALIRIVVVKIFKQELVPETESQS